MDDTRFDQLTRSMAAGTTRRRVLGGVVAAIAGGMALTADGANARKRAKAQKNGKGQDKVEICHKPGTPDEKTIRVAEPAVKAHLKHGDTLGACPCANPCGDDCCGDDEACIGGGREDIPQTCCPTDNVCGGPEAELQICCSNSETCIGEIPNQSCCANENLCGGPENTVKICCTGGTTCVGDIPNQSCA